ncbi:hypothetical protein FS749_016656 [Ceratobasidium sp. UAMH 11750]|nr:hypothetical protein FS749_016656 [Ceratobasidium sp. UAMH 11750]
MESTASSIIDPFAEPDAYHVAFSSIIQRSKESILTALSLNGRYLACYAHDDKLSLLDTQTGCVAGILSFDDTKQVTSMTWISDSTLLIGDSCGHVQAGTLAFRRNMGTDTVMELSTVAHETLHAILALAYDPDTGLFAYADRNNSLLVFRLHLEQSSVKTCQLIDQRMGVSPLGNVTEIKFFGSVTITQTKSLFIGMEFSTGIWMGEKHPIIEFKINHFSVAKAVISQDGRMMAIITPELRVIIWPLLPSGPDYSDERTFQIPVGPNNFPLGSIAPLAFVQGGDLMTANPFGGVYLLSERAEQRWMFDFSSKCVKSILCHGSWIYMTSVDTYNVIRADAYTNVNSLAKFFANASDSESDKAVMPYIQKHVRLDVPELTPIPDVRRQQNLIFSGTCFILAIAAVLLLSTFHVQREVKTCRQLMLTEGYFYALQDFIRNRANPFADI